MRFLLGYGSCGIAAGAAAVEKALSARLTGDIALEKVGCNGMCFAEPLMEVITDSGESIFYGRLTPETAVETVNAFIGGEVPEKNRLTDDEMSFLTKQTRIALRNVGHINPESVDSYIAAGGYTALKKALETGSDAIIAELKTSCLRGRGGAGFPTHFKWQAAKDSPGDEKYIVCNADEGDPGAFMDRSLLEGDPHSVLEGMMIAGVAIGAQTGIIYVRAEYPLAVKRLKKAIGELSEKGITGKNIFGTDYSFEFRIMMGAGAFVCGEETALLSSLGGNRGTPVVKPPFPAQKGFRGKPTNINNVETFANVPYIITHGGGSFSSIGTEESKGTKVFALAGRVKRGGLVEVPMGVTLGDVVFGICGGVRDDAPVKAIQIGGPSGGCLPAELLSTPIDYNSIAATGAIMGSGGLIVMDDTACMVDMARFFMDFTSRESCGKCVPCRIGTTRMREILERIVAGDGKEEDLYTLKELGESVRDAALCGLGASAPNPVLTTLRYFRDEYEAHINEKRCPAGRCKALTHYSINSELCRGCTLCARSCPVGAITGEVKKPHVIASEKCISCGECRKNCKFGAVTVSGKGDA